MTDTEKLLQITSLERGAHFPDSGAMCAMEAVTWIAGEPWSDHPQCVSPVIAEFMRAWNDALSNADRTRLLLPIILDTIGTRTTDADEETRAWMATDWLVRVQAVAWLRLAGLTNHAQALESLSRIADVVTAGTAQPTIAAVRAAARDAAVNAARAAARDAVWAAAGDAAAGAAGGSARAAAWVAAWDAAVNAARAAARDAAWASLAPTVADLQASAQDLVRRMCAVGRVAAAEQEVHDD